MLRDPRDSLKLKRDVYPLIGSVEFGNCVVTPDLEEMEPIAISTYLSSNQQSCVVSSSLSPIPSNEGRDSVYVMQRCTHPRFHRYEITNIHAAPRTMTCV